METIRVGDTGEGSGEGHAACGGPAIMAPVSLDEAVSSFLTHLALVKRRAPATVAAYGRDLEAFREFLAANGPAPKLTGIGRPDIYRWMLSMGSVATATVSRRLNSLSAFFAVCMLLGYVSSSPVVGVERPRNRRRLMPAMGDDDVRGLLAAAKGPVERAVVLTLATTGLRRSELTAVRVEDVDLERRRIRVHGKGGKEREVIIPPELRQVLSARIYGRDLQATGFLFPSRSGRRFHNSTLQRWFSRWVRAAGLEGKGFTIHSLRRYAATRWLQHGLSVPEIQVLLGHKSMETTARYLNVELVRIQERVEALPAIGGRTDVNHTATGSPSPP